MDMHDLPTLRPANIDVDLQFPDGDSPVAARLILRCRDSRFVVAEIDMTAQDLTDLLARRKRDPFETGTEARVAHPELLALVGQQRRIVTVVVPHCHSLDESDDDHVQRWANIVGRSVGAQAHRVHDTRGGCEVTLFFWREVWKPEDIDQLAGVRDTLHESANLRTLRLERRGRA